jgi:tight adherence protein B
VRLIAASLMGCTISLTVAALNGLLPKSFGTRRRPQRQNSTVAALQQAGVEVSAGRFRLASLALGGSAFWLLYVLSGVGMVALALSVFAGMTPRWWLSRRAARRQEAVQRAWPDAVRDIVASIGAGVSLQHALERLGVSGPEPLREPFVRFAVTARAIGMMAALEGVRDDLADPTSDRVIEVLVVAHERGGAIVPEILRDLAAATTKDIWILEQVQTESLEQRINARAVFALPWLVLVAITMQDGPFREFYLARAGFFVIAIGGIASACGMVLVSRLGSQPTEPRVLGGRR